MTQSKVMVMVMVRKAAQSVLQTHRQKATVVIGAGAYSVAPDDEIIYGLLVVH